MSPPLPPGDLAKRTPDIVVLPAGTLIARFFTTGKSPIYFDYEKGGRFNSPNGSYGVLYAAQEKRGAFAETFLRQPGLTLIPLDLVNSKALAILQTLRELNLIKLRGTGLGRLGATAEVVHGVPYTVSQEWSNALYNHPCRPQGIAYSGRHDDEAVCYALFDRGSVCVAESSRIVDVAQDWFWELANKYGVGIAPV